MASATAPFHLLQDLVGDLRPIKNLSNLFLARQLGLAYTRATDKGASISLWEVDVDKDDLENVNDKIDDIVF